MWGSLRVRAVLTSKGRNYRNISVLFPLSSFLTKNKASGLIANMNLEWCFYWVLLLNYPDLPFHIPFHYKRLILEMIVFRFGWNYCIAEPVWWFRVWKLLHKKSHLFDVLIAAAPMKRFLEHYETVLVLYTARFE